MAKSRSLRDIAISILTESLTPLRPERIAARAITAGLLPPGAPSIEVAMEDILDADVGSNGGRSAFVRAPPGHYGLNPDRLPASEGADSDPDMPATQQLKGAAAVILRGSLGPLPIEMIAGRVVSEGMIQPGLRMTLALLEETMAAEIMARGSGSAFVKAASGHYGLRSHPAYDVRDVAQFVPKAASSRILRHPFSYTSYEVDVSLAPAIHDSESDMFFMGSAAIGLGENTAKLPSAKPKPTPKDDRRPYSEYTGRGSEHLVASMLLFHHMDVSIPIVDMGADLITTAGDFPHNYIQVKAVIAKNNSYRFRIKLRSFMRYEKSNMFYVFVLRQGFAPSKITCLVFPRAMLENCIKQGHIQQKGKSFSIKIFQEKTRFLLGPQNLDVTAYKNNWRLLFPSPKRGAQATVHSP